MDNSPVGSPVHPRRSAAAACILLAGCGAVVRPTVDTSMPAVTLEALSGVAPQVMTSADQSVHPDWTGAGATPAGGNPSFVAQARDVESGIQSIELKAAVRVWCVDDPASNTPRRTQTTFDVSARADAPARSDGALPQSRMQVLEIPMPRVLAACAGSATPQLEDYQVDVRAHGINGVGLAASSGTIGIVRGPLQLRVVVLNVCSWCRTPGEAFWPGKTIPPDVLEDGILRSADYFASRDIVLLSEMTDTALLGRLMSRIAQTNGSPFHVAHYDRVAILSRWPLLGPQRSYRNGIWYFPGNPFPHTLNSQLIRAVTVAEGRPIEVYSTHWQHQPAPADLGNPQPSDLNRVEFARETLRMIRSYEPRDRTPLLLGGDFNAQRRRHSPTLPISTELGLISDALRAADDEPEPARFEGERAVAGSVDHLFIRGPYRAVAFTDAPANGMGLFTDHKLNDFVLQRIRD